MRNPRETSLTLPKAQYVILNDPPERIGKGTNIACRGRTAV
jgi:hypothetical protein